MIRRLPAALCAVLSLALPASANPLAKDVFGRVRGPTAGPALS